MQPLHLSSPCAVSDRAQMVTVAATMPGGHPWPFILYCDHVTVPVGMHGIALFLNRESFYHAGFHDSHDYRKCTIRYLSSTTAPRSWRRRGPADHGAHLR